MKIALTRLSLEWFSGVVTAGFVLLAPSFLTAQTPEQILQQKPLQEVEIDTPPADKFSECQVRPFQEGEYSGKCLFGPDGATPLRVVCRKEKSNAEANVVTQLRYFRNGVEVYRDDLLTGESRWMGDAGSRCGIRKEKSSELSAWKSISPEEATAEAVAALVAGDEARYRRVALTKEELAAVGLAGPLAEELGKQIDAIAGFKDLTARLKIPANAKWGAFNGNHPALLAQGKNGLKVDLPIYYNAGVVLTADDSQSHQLYIGDMVKIGDTWKIVGLPSGEPFGSNTGEVSVASIFFPASIEGAAAGTGEGAQDYSEWGTQLTEAHQALADAKPEQAAEQCEKIFKLYMKLAAQIPNEQANFIREAATFLMTEVQSGRYPQGRQRLAELFETLKEKGAEDLVAFVRLRQLFADFYAVLLDPETKDWGKAKAEEDHKANLESFADEYARTDAAAEALLFLALDREYLKENDAAITFYTTVARDFPKAASGRRAAGAVKRLSAVGQTYALPADWTFSDGGPAAIPSGKKTVLFCWAKWSLNPDDIAVLKQLLEADPNLAVVGIGLDGSKKDFDAALLSMGAVPWKTVFVPGTGDASESPAALDLGIQAAPLFILLDASGKMVAPNILTTADLKSYLNPQQAEK